MERGDEADWFVPAHHSCTVTAAEAAVSASFSRLAVSREELNVWMLPAGIVGVAMWMLVVDGRLRGHDEE